MIIVNLCFLLLEGLAVECAKYLYIVVSLTTFIVCFTVPCAAITDEDVPFSFFR